MRSRKAAAEEMLSERGGRRPLGRDCIALRGKSGVLARFLATLVLVMGVFAASANAAYARHGADDGRHHRGGEDGPRHG